MPAYQARVTNLGAKGERLLLGSTTVYADTELEAKISAAEQLGVAQDKIQVAIIADAWVPDDNYYQELGREMQATVPDVSQETTGGSAYG